MKKILSILLLTVLTTACTSAHDSERYYLWSERNGSLFQGDIHHKLWKITDTDLIIKDENILPATLKGAVDYRPFFQYASSKRVLFWPLKRTE